MDFFCLACLIMFLLCFILFMFVSLRWIGPIMFYYVLLYVALFYFAVFCFILSYFVLDYFVIACWVGSGGRRPSLRGVQAATPTSSSKLNDLSRARSHFRASGGVHKTGSGPATPPSPVNTWAPHGVNAVWGTKSVLVFLLSICSFFVCFCMCSPPPPLPTCDN